MEPESFEDFLQLKDLFTSGDITKARKEELARYAVMLCRPVARDRMGMTVANLTQLSDTVRTLLVLRMSEEASQQTTLMSIVAIAVAGVTLLWSVFTIATR